MRNELVNKDSEQNVGEKLQKQLKDLEWRNEDLLTENKNQIRKQKEIEENLLKDIADLKKD